MTVAAVTSQASDMDLFSDSLQQRIDVASKYKTFPNPSDIDDKDKRHWLSVLAGRSLGDGMDWPGELRKQCDPSKWPAFSFGVANAACLIVLPTPGEGGNGQAAGAYIGPHTPNLGGTGHAHCRVWPSINRKNTWLNLDRYVREAFSGLTNPWSAVMVMNLASTCRRTGDVNISELKSSVNNLEFVESVCRPKMILLCGAGVKKAAKTWKPAFVSETLFLDHPSCWDGRMGKGRTDGDRIVRLVHKQFFQKN